MDNQDAASAFLSTPPPQQMLTNPQNQSPSLNKSPHPSLPALNPLVILPDALSWPFAVRNNLSDPQPPSPILGSPATSLKRPSFTLKDPSNPSSKPFWIAGVLPRWRMRAWD